MAKDIKDLQKETTGAKDETKAKNLKPRTKDPEKAAQDEKIKQHINNLLTKNPNGMTAKAMRAEIFVDSKEEEFAKQEKRIRFIARDMGCVATPIPDSRQKIYKLPSK